jgi:hypothetical protein
MTVGSELKACHSAKYSGDTRLNGRLKLDFGPHRTSGGKGTQVA